jgi:hypothetical protein
VKPSGCRRATFILGNGYTIPLVRFDAWEAKQRDSDIGRPFHTETGKTERRVRQVIVFAAGNEIAVMSATILSDQRNPMSARTPEIRSTAQVPLDIG